MVSPISNLLSGLKSCAQDEEEPGTEIAEEKSLNQALYDHYFNDPQLFCGGTKDSFFCSTHPQFIATENHLITSISLSPAAKDIDPGGKYSVLQVEALPIKEYTFHAGWTPYDDIPPSELTLTQINIVNLGGMYVGKNPEIHFLTFAEVIFPKDAKLSTKDINRKTENAMCTPDTFECTAQEIDQNAADKIFNELVGSNLTDIKSQKEWQDVTNNTLGEALTEFYKANRIPEASEQNEALLRESIFNHIKAKDLKNIANASNRFSYVFGKDEDKLKKLVDDILMLPNDQYAIEKYVALNILYNSLPVGYPGFTKAEAATFTQLAVVKTLAPESLPQK